MEEESMKKIFKAFAFIASLAMLGGAFVSCSNGDDEPTKYTVSFETNGGSAVEAQTVESGKKATKPTDPTKDGFIFENWYKESELTTTWNFDTDTVTKNITLYAKWEEEELVEYTISYKDGDSDFTAWKSGYTAPESYTVESDAITLPVADNVEKTGAVFNGWYESSELTGDAVTQIASGSTGDKVFYAKWTELQAGEVSVTFNTNGGTAIDAQVIVSGGTAAKPENPTKQGYTFENWYSDEDLTSAFDFSSAITANTTVYAKWTVISYTITYANVENATNPNAETSYTIESETITLQAATKSGYTFAGWKKTDENGSSITSISKGSTGNVVLYAVWTINKHKVIYSAGDGVTASNMPASSETDDTDFGTTVAISNTTPTRENYTFLSWTATGVTLGSDATSFTMPDNDVTLTAQWTPLPKIAMSFDKLAANVFTDADGDSSQSWTTWNTNATDDESSTTPKVSVTSAENGEFGYVVTVSYDSSRMQKNTSSNASMASTYGKATWAVTTTTFTDSADGVTVVYNDTEYGLIGDSGFFFGYATSDATMAEAEKSFHDWWLLRGGVDGTADGRLYNRSGKSTTLTFKKEGYADTTVVWNFEDTAKNIEMTWGKLGTDVFTDAENSTDTSWTTWSSNASHVTVTQETTGTGYAVTYTYNSSQMAKNKSSDASQSANEGEDGALYIVGTTDFGERAFSTVSITTTSGAKGNANLADDNKLTGTAGCVTVGAAQPNSTTALYDWWYVENFKFGNDHYTLNGKTLTRVFSADGCADTVVTISFVDEASNSD